MRIGYLVIGYKVKYFGQIGYLVKFLMCPNGIGFLLYILLDIWPEKMVIWSFVVRFLILIFDFFVHLYSTSLKGSCLDNFRKQLKWVSFVELRSECRIFDEI